MRRPLCFEPAVFFMFGRSIAPALSPFTVGRSRERLVTHHCLVRVGQLAINHPARAEPHEPEAGHQSSLPLFGRGLASLLLNLLVLPRQLLKLSLNLVGDVLRIGEQLERVHAAEAPAHTRQQ